MWLLVVYFHFQTFLAPFIDTFSKKKKQKKNQKHKNKQVWFKWKLNVLKKFKYRFISIYNFQSRNGFHKFDFSASEFEMHIKKTSYFVIGDENKSVKRVVFTITLIA